MHPWEIPLAGIKGFLQYWLSDVMVMGGSAMVVGDVVVVALVGRWTSRRGTCSELSRILSK